MLPHLHYYFFERAIKPVGREEKASFEKKGSKVREGKKGKGSKRKGTKDRKGKEGSWKSGVRLIVVWRLLSPQPQIPGSNFRKLNFDFQLPSSNFRKWKVGGPNFNFQLPTSGC